MVDHQACLNGMSHVWSLPKETCLVESFNGSLRGRFARFNRRTKAYSKSFNNLKDTVFIWVNREQYLANIKVYSNRFIYDNISINNTNNTNNTNINYYYTYNKRKYTYTGFNKRRRLNKHKRTNYKAVAWESKKL